ncbi:MAG: multi-sensor hybrid histidine kinase [Tardiphaga sp.]|nr:multi-sensor hybrid histidine kinase [Tardiphaga sp.]
MKLSTRLMAAMTTLVLGTAVVGMVGYHNVESAVIPVSLDRLMTQAKARLGLLDILLRGVRGDVLALRAMPAHDGLVRAAQNGGIDAVENVTEATWRARIEGIYVAQLRAKPALQQLRMIGIADGGREIVRVDRPGPGDAIRVVATAELQQKADRGYFRDAVALPAGEVFISPIELNQEYGVIEVPHIPVQRFATLITDAEGRPFGIVIANLDIRPIFDGIRAAMDEHSLIYLVNDAGDFLLHPDNSRAFGFDLGQRHRWQDDFTGLAQAIGTAGDGAAVVEGADGQRVAAVLVTARVADGPSIGIIETELYATIMAPALALRKADLWAALGGVGLAIVLAMVMARSLSRPLRQITAAVEGFARGEPIRLPTGSAGEIGILAAAFARMARDVRDNATALRDKSEIFDKTIESMADGFLIVDTDGETVFANSVYKSLVGGDDPQIAPADRQKHYQPLHADGVTPMVAVETPTGRMLRGENFDNVEVAFAAWASSS